MTAAGQDGEPDRRVCPADARGHDWQDRNTAYFCARPTHEQQVTTGTCSRCGVRRSVTTRNGQVVDVTDEPA